MGTIDLTSKLNEKGPHTSRCAGPFWCGRYAQLEPTALSVLAMLLPAALTFWPWRVGLLVDHLEVTTQLGDELLAGHRTGAAPEVTGSQHIANDGLVLGLERGGLGADQCAVGVDVAELIIDAHCLCPPEFEISGGSGPFRD